MVVRRRCLCLLVVGCAAAAAIGCRAARQVRDPEFADVTYAVTQAWHSADPVTPAIAPVVDELAGPHPVELYVEFALAQNPRVQAARKRVEVQAYRVPQAASLDDPTLSVTGWPFFPNVPQTAAGRVTVDTMVSQEVPWYGTLRTRAQAAAADVDLARSELWAAQLETIEKVRRAYYELYYVQQSLRITEEDRKLLQDLVPIVESRYKTGKVNQQDLLRAQVEVSNLDGELIRMRQQLQSARAALARLLHVSPETPLQTLDTLAVENVPGDLDRLYRIAVQARPELHAQLAAIERDRRKVELAQLQYFPDLTLGVAWGEMTTNRALASTADGLDMVGLSLMVNLPVYRKRLDAGVREAEAQVVSSAREYDALRDEALEEVTDLFAQAGSQQELARLFRDDILPKAEQTLQVSIRAYTVGEIDFLQLIDNWRQVLRFQLALHRIESQLRQSTASLERAVGGQIEQPQEPEPLPLPAPDEGPQL